jgi:hypothetical protein
VLKPGVSSEPIQGTSLKVLIKDPYILLTAGEYIRKRGFSCLQTIIEHY